tara:strand:- start:2620 stop:3201 length:582 start_codon:yes stop_codon:yes gene_type:complete
MHINKTAGTSIEVALDGWKPHSSDPEKHMNVKSIVEKHGEELWEKYFTFTFVRNPWDRMVSMFFWRKRVKFIPKELEFKEFVMDWEYWKMFRIKDSNDRDFVEKKILTSLPQLEWFDPKFKLDFVGRFENVQKDFDLVCDKLNIKKIKLQNRYKTFHDHYSLYYDKETINKIKKIWGVDIKAFNYQFVPEYQI